MRRGNGGSTLISNTHPIESSILDVEVGHGSEQEKVWSY